MFICLFKVPSVSCVSFKLNKVFIRYAILIGKVRLIALIGTMWPRMITCKFIKKIKKMKRSIKAVWKRFCLKFNFKYEYFTNRFDLNLTWLLKLIWKWFGMHFTLIFLLVAEDYHWPRVIICWYDELLFLIRNPWRRATFNLYFYIYVKHV